MEWIFKRDPIDRPFPRMQFQRFVLLKIKRLTNHDGWSRCNWGSVRVCRLSLRERTSFRGEAVIF